MISALLLAAVLAQAPPEATIPVFSLAPLPTVVTAARDVSSDVLPSSTFQRFQVIAATNGLPLYPPEQAPLVDPLTASMRLFGRPVAQDTPRDVQHQTVVDVLYAFSNNTWGAVGATEAKATTWAQQVVGQWATTIVNNHAASVPDFLPIRVCGVLHTTFRDNVQIMVAMNGTTPVFTSGGSALSWMTITSPAGCTDTPTQQCGGYPQIQAAMAARGCDVVQMESGTDSCGLSYECPATIFGFSSVDISCAISNFSAIHESGHTFCGNHEPESDCGKAVCGNPPSDDWAVYAHGNGYPRDGSGIKFRDPLTYPREGGIRDLYWSSDLTFRTINGKVYATGIAGTKDNARAFRENMQRYADVAVPVNAPPAPAAPGIPSFTQ